MAELATMFLTSDRNGLHAQDVRMWGKQVDEAVRRAYDVVVAVAGRPASPPATEPPPRNYITYNARQLP